MDERTLIGLVGGSACDGVDAALVRVAGAGEQMTAAELRHVFVPYADSLGARLWEWSGLRPPGALEGADPPRAARALAALDRDLAACFAQAAARLIEESGADRRGIAGVGLSGQPLAREKTRGEGEPRAEIELGAPAVVAESVGLPVVSGFRASDLAAGGCGSPVAAWADWRLLRHERLSRVAVHLGGLATLTFVGSNALAGDVTGFDVGPGTLVIDQLVREHFRRDFDADGREAARHRMHAELLNELLSNGYFAAAGPKSTSAAAWGWAYRRRTEMAAERRGCEIGDLVATATELTAQSVAKAVAQLTERPHEIALSGGGALNIHLAGRIRALLSPSSTYAFDRYGPSVRGKQGVSTAMLAAARLDGYPAHCPQATGAARAAVLGSVTKP